MIFMEEASRPIVKKRINNVLQKLKYLLQTAAPAKRLQHIKSHSSLQGLDMQSTRRMDREIKLPN